MEIDELDLAYIAGFFDGEGTITIHHRNSLDKINWYRVCASISNTDISLLEYLKDLFGGHISTRIYGGNRKDMYQWQVTSKDAVRFISVISPYLRQKSTQAEVSLEFEDTIHRGNVSGRPTKLRYTDTEVEYREHLCGVMRELNHRGI